MFVCIMSTCCLATATLWSFDSFRAHRDFKGSFPWYMCPFQVLNCCYFVKQPRACSSHEHILEGNSRVRHDLLPMPYWQAVNNTCADGSRMMMMLRPLSCSAAAGSGPSGCSSGEHAQGTKPCPIPTSQTSDNSSLLDRRLLSDDHVSLGVGTLFRGVFTDWSMLMQQPRWTCSACWREVEFPAKCCSPQQRPLLQARRDHLQLRRGGFPGLQCGSGWRWTGAAPFCCCGRCCCPRQHSSVRGDC
jgi:hypothetical protein